MGSLVGNRLKLARYKSNLNMRALASKAHISAQSVSKYERGINMPSSDVMIRLAKALDVKVEYFFRQVSVGEIYPVYRKKKLLDKKKERVISGVIREWLERYLEVESLCDISDVADLPNKHIISNMDQIEDVAIAVRSHLGLGLSPIDNLIELLEGKGIKIGLVDAFDEFDSCLFQTDDGRPVMAVNKNIPGDRQRFSISHELGHLFLDCPDHIDVEKACNRFAGAFITPRNAVFSELGKKRKGLDPFELHLLKHKYGLSMLGWVHRAEDLEIISEIQANKIVSFFRKKGWNIEEPGDQLEREKPNRKTRLVFRALEENLISVSKASELLNKPVEEKRKEMSKKHANFPITICG